ncbi:unnamed protein product [Protopolystoma xenopodis]|uniref:Dynamin-like GTPase OPA1 C-terminal domain-containing protein n=1 Tax=Protopolystoma xenopodis TaxID=117903 RepID=A0A3S5FG69_9PLAT|nr:unnamed protein product [Protopolystoma xenopodis]
MIPCSDDVRHMTDESLVPFYRNRKRLLRKQRQHESFSKANRQLVKRNPPSSSSGTGLRISSPNTFTRNGMKRPASLKDDRHINENSISLHKFATSSTSTEEAEAARNEFPNCIEVLLFARLRRMLTTTSRSLRQLIVDNEGELFTLFVS